MTGLLHEREFSRKSFVKAGGALVIGFSALGALGAGKAKGATGNTPFGQRGPQDFLPNLQSIDSWIAIRADNSVIVTHGETELGHGTPTGILMLVAEELNTNFNQMIYAHPETWLNATGGGGGSGGISSRSTQTRAAAAYAKQVLLGLASKQLGVPAASLSVSGGVVSGGGKTVTYGALLGGRNFNFTMPLDPAHSTSATATQYIPGAGITKPVSQYSLVGTPIQRIDVPAKINGSYTYIQNVHIPGMIHGRSVRPRGAGANTSVNHEPISVDPTSIAHIPGAQVIQINNMLGVVAPKEYDAIQAASQLKVVWKSDPKFTQSGNYWSWMRKAADTNTVNPARYTTDTGGVPQALASAATKITATYRYHYNNFVPIGPHCAVADVNNAAKSAIMYVQGQSLNTLPGNFAGMLGFPSANNVRVVWYEGASSFGGGQQGEVGEQAAMFAQKVGVPVRVQWMRWDQTGWDSYGPSQQHDVTMGVDKTGKIVAADWTTYGQAGSTIDTTKELLGTAVWPASPASASVAPSDNGIYSANGYGKTYTFPRRVLAKSQPMYGGSLKSSALRAPNAPQSYFASEQIVDELAHAMNMDPIAFRKLNIDPTVTLGARWLSVIDGATIAAGWKSKVAASNLQSGNVVTGRGFGMGTFASSQAATVADIQVTKSTGKILVKHLFIAQNNGITISPSLVTNQMSGAAIQGLSRAMWEMPTWNTERVTSLDWVTYPILRFAESPKVTLINVHPSQYVTVVPGDMTTDVKAGNTNAFNEGWLLTGSGEPPTTAVGSAVANAFFDATGVRVRQAPMRPAVIRGVLKQAGVTK